MRYFKKTVNDITIFGSVFGIDDELYCIVYDPTSFSPLVMKTPLILKDGYSKIDAIEYYELLKNHSQRMIEKIET